MGIVQAQGPVLDYHGSTELLLPRGARKGSEAAEVNRKQAFPYRGAIQPDGSADARRFFTVHARDQADPAKELHLFDDWPRQTHWRAWRINGFWRGVR